MKIEKTFSAKSAIYLRHTSWISANAELTPPKAFRGCLHGDLNFLGRCPRFARRIRPVVDLILRQRLWRFKRLQVSLNRSSLRRAIGGIAQLVKRLVSEFAIQCVADCRKMQCALKVGIKSDGTPPHSNSESFRECGGSRKTQRRAISESADRLTLGQHQGRKQFALAAVVQIASSPRSQ